MSTRSTYTLIVMLFSAMTGMGQVTVTNDGLDLTLEAGLTATIQGSYVNQTNGADLGTIDNAGIITLTHDWTNNSANTVFSANTGQTRFIGTANDQVIGGTNSTEFYNLELNNVFGSESEFTFNVDATAKNTLTMSSGVSDLNSNTFTIGVSAAAPGTLVHGNVIADGFFRNGTLKRWYAAATVADGNVAGLFPVGGAPDGYKGIHVTAPASAPTVGGSISIERSAPGETVDVSFLDGASTVEIRQIANWSIATGDGLAGGTYNMRATGNDYGAITDVNDLRITLAGSVVGTAGVNGGVPGLPIVNRTGLTLANLTNTFYMASIDKANTPLPVELLFFNATLIEEDNVELEWATVSEINSAQFELQHSSDGINFTTFASQNAAGNSLIKIDYLDNHYYPTKGINFYRLKQIDIDGSYAYSNIEAIEIDGDVQVKAFPIPSYFGDVNFTLEGYNGDIALQLTDNSGQLLMDESYFVSGDRLKLIIPREIFGASGVYYLRVTYGSKQHVERLVYYE